MKKTCIFMMVLVLTLSVLTACGCRNSKPAETTMPTTGTTAATTEATTMPTTMATEPSTDATIQDGNGPLSTDATTETDDTGSGNARSGGMVGGSGSGGMVGGSGSGGMGGGSGSGGMGGGSGSGNGITGSIS